MTTTPSGKPTARPRHRRGQDLLCQRVRVAQGRAATATAAVIDSQSVKISSNVSESSQGIDAGKKIKGRKRHIATDVLGLLLVVIVTAASAQDSVGGQGVLDHLAADHPDVSATWVDGGCNNTVVGHGARRGIQVEVVKRPTTKGFHVLPRRWVVERTLGWLMQRRRLVRDYEALPQRSRTMVHWAMSNIMSRALAGESTQPWRNDLLKTERAFGPFTQDVAWRKDTAYSHAGGYG